MPDIIKFDNPKMIERVAAYFSRAWGIPYLEYVKSLRAALSTEVGVPLWYLLLDGEEIVGGVGVIENDFHKRRDLTPNICALIVNEEYRGRGLARGLIERVCEDLRVCNISDVYLITTHTELYERLGFEYYDDIEENDGGFVRCYHKRI